MSRADLVTLLVWVGTAVLAAWVAAWARYFMIRYGAEEEVASLRLPVAATIALLVVLTAVVVTDPGTPT